MSAQGKAILENIRSTEKERDEHFAPVWAGLPGPVKSLLFSRIGESARFGPWRLFPSIIKDQLIVEAGLVRNIGAALKDFR